MSWQDEQLKEVVERTDELAKEWLDHQKPYDEGTPYGMNTLSEPEFMAWFLMKSSANPNWALALHYVDGGEAEWRRFERIMAKIDKGMGAVA